MFGALAASLDGSLKAAKIAKISKFAKSLARPRQRAMHRSARADFWGLAFVGAAPHFSRRERCCGTDQAWRFRRRQSGRPERNAKWHLLGRRRLTARTPIAPLPWRSWKSWKSWRVSRSRSKPPCEGPGREEISSLSRDSAGSEVRCWIASAPSLSLVVWGLPFSSSRAQVREGAWCCVRSSTWSTVTRPWN